MQDATSVDPLTAGFLTLAGVTLGGCVGYLLGRGHEHQHMQQLIDEERARYPGARGLPLDTLDYRIRMGQTAFDDRAYQEAPRRNVPPDQWRSAVMEGKPVRWRRTLPAAQALEAYDAERPSYRFER